MRSRPPGFTIQIHLLNGDPHGIRVVSRAGWDGYLLVIPSFEANAARELDEELNRISTVVLLGTSGDGKTRVHVAHASPAVSHVDIFTSDELWTHMFVLGRESDFPKIFARQVALRLIEAARRHGAAEVVDTYPTPPKPVRAAVRDEVDDFIGEALIFLGLCGVTAFGANIFGERSRSEVERSPSRVERSASQGEPTAQPRTPVVGSERSRSASKDIRPPRVPPSQSRSHQLTEKAHYDEDMQLLLDLGFLKGGQVLRLPQPRKGVAHNAIVEPDGAIRFQNRRYLSPSGAAVAATGTSSNGWTAWHIADGRPLDALRKKARGGMGKTKT